MADEASDVISYISWLENESGYQDLKAAQKRYREIYQLTDDPELPDEITRGTSVLDNSPFIGELSDQIVAQVLGYSVFSTAQPLNGLSEAKADTIEQWLAIWMARRNPGDALRAKAYRQCLNNTHLVFLLDCGGADEDDPWDVRLPLLDTCFFEPQDAPWFRPPVLGRRSKLLMREVSEKYSDLKGDHDGAGDRLFFDSKGKPAYQAMSAELPDDSFSLKSSPKDYYGKEVELYQLWDDENEIHVIKGIGAKKGTEGTVVFKTKNYTGGVPAIVVPSLLTGDKETKKNYRPGLWSGYQYTAQLNRLRAVRATKAERSVPHVFRLLPPELTDAVKKALSEQLTNPSALQAGSANIIDLTATDVKFWTPLEDKDAELREARKVQERDAYAASWRLPTSPDVVQQGTVGVYQMAAQAVHARETPLLKAAWDFPMAKMGEMALHSLSHYEREYSFTAESTLAYGDGKELAKGKSVTLGTDTKIVVYGGERNVSVQVTTLSQTEAEKRLAIQEAVYDESVGIGTRDQTLAIKYSNVTDQHSKQAKDLGFKKYAPIIEQQAQAMLTDYLRLTGGAYFLLQALAPAPVSPQPTDMAGGGPRPVPDTGGGGGGSDGGGVPANAMAGVGP